MQHLGRLTTYLGIFCLSVFSNNILLAQPSLDDFPWLDSLISVEDCCVGTRATAYQSGIFTFVYVERGADCGPTNNELYFQDGTFYCLEINDLDCRVAYGLTDDMATILFECSEEEPTDTINCPALDALNINPAYCESCISEVALYELDSVEYVVTEEGNPICSDGITIVRRCDDPDGTFCLQGGIGGFNQCEDFFARATKTKTIWSRLRDCEVEPVIEIAPPCTDVAGIDFGLCEAIMGVALVDGQCQFVSGCLDFTVKGVNYEAAFFPTVQLCRQSCEADSPEEPDDFDVFGELSWLSEVVDTTDCAGTTVEVYEQQDFLFVYVQDSMGSSLYFENGAFYCMDLPGYNCRELYGLNVDKPIGRYVCSNPQGPVSPDNSFFGTDVSRPAPRANSAFPNPTRGAFTIELSESLPAATIRVYRPNGQLIQTIPQAPAQQSLDLSAETPGIYLVEIEQAGKRQMLKLVKQ